MLADIFKARVALQYGCRASRFYQWEEINGAVKGEKEARIKFVVLQNIR